ncbi:unnamed protein product [Ixodes persulcatus]
MWTRSRPRRPCRRRERCLRPRQRPHQRQPQRPPSTGQHRQLSESVLRPELHVVLTRPAAVRVRERRATSLPRTGSRRQCQQAASSERQSVLRLPSQLLSSTTPVRQRPLHQRRVRPPASACEQESQAAPLPEAELVSQSAMVSQTEPLRLESESPSPPEPDIETQSRLLPELLSQSVRQRPPQLPEGPPTVFRADQYLASQEVPLPVCLPRTGSRHVPDRRSSEPEFQTTLQPQQIVPQLPSVQPLTALMQEPGTAVFSGPPRILLSDSLPEPPQDSPIVPIVLQQQTYSVLEPLPHAVHQSMAKRRTSLPVPLPVLQLGAHLDSHLGPQLESSLELQLKPHLGSKPKLQPKTKLVPQRPPPPPPQALRPVCQRRPPQPEPRAEVDQELHPEPPPEQHSELQLISERPPHPSSEPMPQSQPTKLVPQPHIHSYVPCVQALQTEPCSELHLEPRFILQRTPAQSALMPQKRTIKPVIQPELQSEPQSYVQPGVQSDLQPEPYTEPVSEPHLEPQLILERLPLPSTQPIPQRRPSKVAPQPETQPELQSYVQPGVKSELLLEPLLEPHTEPHLEPQQILEPPPLPSHQTEPRSQSIQPEPRLKLQPGLQPNAQADPQPETQPEPHPEPHAQSQSEPLSAPRRLPPPLFQPGSRQTAAPSKPEPEPVSEPLLLEPETPGPPPQRPPRRLRRRGVDDSSAFHDGRPRRPVQGDLGQDPERPQDVTGVLRPPPRGIPVVRRPSERPGSAARPFGKPASGAAEQRPPH